MSNANSWETLIKADIVYQQMLHKYMDLEEEFLRVRNSLPAADQEILDAYIALGEEMDHRLVTLALSLQKEPAL